MFLTWSRPSAEWGMKLKRPQCVIPARVLRSTSIDEVSVTVADMRGGGGGLGGSEPPLTSGI